MGKVVSKIAKVVAIGALIVGTVLTGGAVAAGWAAAGWTGATAAIGAVSAIKTAFTVAAFASSVAQALNKPKLDIGEQTAQRTELNLQPSPRRKWVFGLTAAAMDMIYAEVYGDDDETTTVVVAHAGHEITSYQRMWIDGELVTFSGNNATGDWENLLSIERKLGTAAQTALSINSGTRWTSDEKATGIAVQALTFTRNQEKNPRGVPSRIVQEIEASPVYDPRLDTTEGGSGAHRADDQTTWEYNDGVDDIGRNAALVYLTYLIGWRDSGDVVLGVGIPVDDIMYDTFIEAANVCEANDWFFDGILVDGDHRRNLRAILDCFAGSPLEVGGKFGVRAPFDDTSVIALAVTSDRIMGQVHREGPPSFRERVNLARGRYISPDNAYQPEEYPEVVLSDLVAIDGSELPVNLDFTGTQDPDTAQQLAGVMLREARQPEVRVVIDQTGLAVCPGDIISLTLDEIGFSTTLVRVEEHVFSFENLNTFIRGKVVQSSDYSLVDPGDAADSLSPTTSAFDGLRTRVDMSGLAAVAVDINTLYGTITSTVRYGFALSWDTPTRDILHTQIQYKPTAESDWIDAPLIVGDTNGDPNSCVIVNIEPDTDYDIRGRHVNLYGYPGEWDTIQESSTVRPLNSPQNLTLTESLVLNSNGQYSSLLSLAFSKPSGDLNVLSYEAQYRFLPVHGSTWQPLFNSTRVNWEFPVAQIGQYQVRVRTVYIQDIVYSDWAEVSETVLGTFSAIATIGLATPQNPELYATLDTLNKRIDFRVRVGYDTSGNEALPESFVIFYSVDDIPNRLILGDDDGSKLRIASVNIEGEIEKTATGGTATTVTGDFSDLEVDLSGMWWVSIDNGSQQSRYFKIVRADTGTLAINPGEEFPFTPGAGDTINIAEISYHDSRLPEFKLGYAHDDEGGVGEVINHNGIDYDNDGYFIDVTERGAEGTTQADQTGATFDYFPAVGIDSIPIEIPIEDFEEVDGVLEYTGNVGVQVPAYFSWASATCCFVRSGSNSTGAKYIRSNIVPFTNSGNA